MSRGGMGWASTVVVGAMTGIALTADRLPARVASHFGANGLADGYMSLKAYLAFTVGAVVIAPALVAVAVAVSVRRFPGAINLPNRDYWLEPGRREATTQYLTAHTARLAALLSVFVLAVHLLVVRANRLAPPALDTHVFLGILVAFAISMIAWVASLARRFRRD